MGDHSTESSFEFIKVYEMGAKLPFINQSNNVITNKFNNSKYINTIYNVKKQ